MTYIENFFVIDLIIYCLIKGTCAVYHLLKMTDQVLFIQEIFSAFLLNVHSHFLSRYVNFFITEKMLGKY